MMTVLCGVCLNVNPMARSCVECTIFKEGNTLRGRLIRLRNGCVATDNSLLSSGVSKEFYQSPVGK